MEEGEEATRGSLDDRRISGRRWGRAPRSTRRRRVGWNGLENDGSRQLAFVWLSGPSWRPVRARSTSHRERSQEILYPGGRPSHQRPPGKSTIRGFVCHARHAMRMSHRDARSRAPRTPVERRPSRSHTPESPSSPSVARRHPPRSRARCSPSPRAIPPPSRSGALPPRSPLARASRPPRPSAPRARPAPAPATSPPARRVPSRRSPRTSSRR